MRWIVTGGAGYIGAHVVALLRARGEDVTVLDDLSTGHPARVGDARLVRCDVKDRAATRAAFLEARPDAVIHFAAKKQVGESVAEPLLYYHENVGGLVSVLEGMRASGCKRMVFSSSAATYGVPPVQEVSEDTPCQPINPYGETKLIGEWILADAARAHDLSTVALRYFNVAGADEERKLADPFALNLVPIVLGAHAERRAVRVFGRDYPTADGTCVRDYIHVMDLAEAHLAAAERIDGVARGRVYNVGCGRGFSVLEVIAAAERVVGAPIAREDAPRRPGDPPALVARPERIQHELGWRARRTSLEEIIGSAWRAR